MNPPLLSLVIPAWNEARQLPRLFDSLDVARARWVERGGRAEAIEVIVADNASTDATAQVAQARGARVAAVDKRVIAAARNGGAAIAGGEVLAFVDADSRVHPDVFCAIAAAMASPRTLGGATGVTMERWSLPIALTYASVLPMVWLTGFDTGVVFWRRSDFVDLGGYDESRLAAEDVHFLWRLSRLGKIRGQRLVRLRGVQTVTSARKFDQYGDWHYLRQMPRVAWHALTRSGRLDEFVRKYWYEGR